MTELLVVLDPTVEAAVSSGHVLARPASLAGLKVGYLDNGKPNSDNVLRELADRLGELGALAGPTIRKGNQGRVAEPELVDELVERCDVVITGVGDCAGCCSCTVQDAITLEQRGIVAFAMCTVELVTTARIAASAAGVPDYPLIVLDHPLGSLGPELISRRVEQALAQLP
jgi:hypothetical protein